MRKDHRTIVARFCRSWILSVPRTGAVILPTDVGVVSVESVLKEGSGSQRIVGNGTASGHDCDVYLQGRGKAAGRGHDVRQSVYVSRRAALAHLQNHRHPWIGGIGLAISPSGNSTGPQNGGKKPHAGTDHGIWRRRGIGDLHY